MLGVAGGLALGLATLGLYGVLAYVVTRRRREIGIRLALGTSRQDVFRLFVGEGARLALAGIVVGLLPAVAVTYALAGSLVGIRSVDACR